jgi:hypothetical protein
MEVIWEYEITEDNKDVTSAIINLDNNGLPFKLDEMRLYINAGQKLGATSSTITVSCNNASGNDYRWFTVAVDSGRQYTQGYAKRVKQNEWFTIKQSPNVYTYNATLMSGYPMYAVDYATSIHIANVNALPTGAKYVLCGRKVD